MLNIKYLAMKHCFGPVPSRRLGLSLGIDMLPKKTCNLDCVYCEIGPTRKYSTHRAQYTPVGPIKDELKKVLTSGKVKFDHVTFTASGEPTLHANLGELIAFAKDLTDKPVAILTNSTLLHHKEVRRELGRADILLPSLDSVNEASFRKINRPAPGIELAEIIKGLERLRQEFQGQIWLETLLVSGINDSEQEASMLASVMQRLEPDKIQLNTVDRPPAVDWARPVSLSKMEKFSEILGPKTEIVVDFRKKIAQGHARLLETEILDLLARRPLRDDDIEKLFASAAKRAKEILARLEDSGNVTKKCFKDENFYMLAPGIGPACEHAENPNAEKEH